MCRRASAADSFVVHNLASNGAVPADHDDPSLVNAWGISAGFLFAGEAGTNLGWNPAVAPTSAVVGADRSTLGALVARVARPTPRGPLDAPWGIAMAPAWFGSFGGDLLVGNFGDGKISAYTQLANGRWVYKGQLRDPSGNLVAIDGLWGIGFGNGSASGPVDSLYFAAGPNDEKAGLFGSIRAAG